MRPQLGGAVALALFALDTIVAWRPGTPPASWRTFHTCLLRGDDSRRGEVVIAAGSLLDGSASQAVLAFLPTSGRVVPLGQLRAPHGAAATLGHIAYLVGGRGMDTIRPPRGSSRSTPPATGCESRAA